MKSTIAAVLSAIAFPVFAGTLTIADLPNAPEEKNPICHDGNGRLANCAPGAGTARKYLAPIVRDGEGLELGTLVGDTEVFFELSILSSEDYLFGVSRGSGTIMRGPSSIEFEEYDCQGSTLIRARYHGGVFKLRSINGDYQLYYVPKNAAVRTIAAKSVQYGSRECVNVDWSAEQYVTPVPNDPSVTGVANKGTDDNPYPLPITIDRP